MPNWCENRVVIKDTAKTSKSKERFEAVMYALNMCNIDDGLSFFNFIKPRPKIWDDDWYEWNVENWGTKWSEKVLNFWLSEEGDKVEILFETAWSPPTPILDALLELGLDVQSEFFEKEGGYLGTYCNGVVNSHSIVEESSYTNKEMLDFMKEHNVEWATNGCLGSEDAYIKLYNEKTNEVLCKYPWDCKDSFTQAVSFIMDLHKKNNDGEEESGCVNV